jgi:hypothetical protein
MNKANWANAIAEITESFYVGHFQDNRRQSMVNDVYRVLPSRKAYEDHLAKGAFGSGGWNSLSRNGRIGYDERREGYKTRYEHATFAKGFLTDRELVDDNRIDEVFDDARALGDAAFRFREKAAAGVFVNAFTDSGTDDFGFAIAGADGVGLCSAAHPNSPTDSNTQSNEGTLALSKANLETTRQNHMALNDDRGDLLNVMPDELWVPPELANTADILVGSDKDPESAENAINPQNGRFKVKVWHYMSDANAWFTADSALRNADLIWYDRVPLEFDTGFDKETQMYQAFSYMRFSRKWRDWRWVYGQNPS